MDVLRMDTVSIVIPAYNEAASIGPLEFVEDGVTGWVTEPQSEAIGAAISHLAADRPLARSLGDAGYARARSITWDGVVERLVGANGS